MVSGVYQISGNVCFLCLKYYVAPCKEVSEFLVETSSLGFSPVWVTRTGESAMTSFGGYLSCRSESSK